MTFLDTNVCLDILAKRSPWHQDAERLVKYHIKNSMEIGVSVITIPTLSYLIKRYHKGADLYNTLDSLFGFSQILDVTGTMTQNAIYKKWNDIEDAIQHECALSHNAICIITRNGPDYENSELPIFHPSEWNRLFIE